MSDPLPTRVPAADVVRVLALVASPPNRRTRPQPGDREGLFSFWFDGGACTQHTGSEQWEFTDGTAAFRAAPSSLLWIEIVFPTGAVVRVVQTAPAVPAR